VREEKAMREERMKREAFWVVEVTKDKTVVYNRRFGVFDEAWEKYISFKNHDERATISLQRRFKEVKVA
jgi:hypothetical protein